MLCHMYILECLFTLRANSLAIYTNSTNHCLIDPDKIKKIIPADNRISGVESMVARVLTQPSQV